MKNKDKISDMCVYIKVFKLRIVIHNKSYQYMVSAMKINLKKRQQLHTAGVLPSSFMLLIWHLAPVSWSHWLLHR